MQTTGDENTVKKPQAEGWGEVEEEHLQQQWSSSEDPDVSFTDSSQYSETAIAAQCERQAQWEREQQCYNEQLYCFPCAG